MWQSLTYQKKPSHPSTSRLEGEDTSEVQNPWLHPSEFLSEICSLRKAPAAPSPRHSPRWLGSTVQGPDERPDSCCVQRDSEPRKSQKNQAEDSAHGLPSKLSTRTINPLASTLGELSENRLEPTCGQNVPAKAVRTGSASASKRLLSSQVLANHSSSRRSRRSIAPGDGSNQHQKPATKTSIKSHRQKPNRAKTEGAFFALQPLT